jgi:hypothetical protein
MAIVLPHAILDETFRIFRQCGQGTNECQVLWLSSWQAPSLITAAIHSGHSAHAGGFAVDDHWLTRFWQMLADADMGIRVQVHTHPGEAFHSPTDDAFPIIHQPDFLSLVIPSFGLGPVGFENAYLTQINAVGKWVQVPIDKHLRVS